MLAFKGYFNGERIVTLEKIKLNENQKVIITVLDEYIKEKHDDKPYKKYIGSLDLQSFNEINETLKEFERIDKDEW